MNHSGCNKEHGDCITQVTTNDGVPRNSVTYICRVYMYVFFDLELHSSSSLEKIKCKPFLLHLFHMCTFDGTCRQPVKNEHVCDQCKLHSSCNDLNQSTCKTSKNCKTHLPHREVAQFQNLLIRNNWKSARDYCEKKNSQELMEEFSSTIDLKGTQIFWDKKLLFFSSECKQDML